MVGFENSGFEVLDLGVKCHNFGVSKSLGNILYFTFVYLTVPMIQNFRESLEWIPGKKHARLWIKFGLYMEVWKM